MITIASFNFCSMSLSSISASCCCTSAIASLEAHPSRCAFSRKLALCATPYSLAAPSAFSLNALARSATLPASSHIFAANSSASSFLAV